MGVGHLDIGQGIGDTKVFNPNPAIQMYGQMLAQRKVKQDADNKVLGDILAKGYDPSTLRNDADRASYLKQYGDIKQSAIKIADEKDPVKKALGLAQVRQQLGDLGTYAENSKKQGLQEHAWAQSYMTNPDNWDDKALNAYRTSKESELNTPETIKDFTTLQRRIDHDKVDKLYAAHKDLLTKNLQYDNGTQTPGEVAGKKGVYVVQSRGLPMDGDNGAFESTLHWATAHPDVVKSLNERYPSIKGETPQATTAAQVKQYMIDNGDTNGIYDRTKPVFKEAYKPDSEPKPSWLESYWLKHAGVPYNPNPPSQGVSNQMSPSQILGEAMRTQTAGSGEKFLSLIPTGQYGTDPKHKPAIHIDPQTGEHIFEFSPQIDQRAVEFNKGQKAKWAKEYPGEPFDPTDKDFKLKEEKVFPAKIGKDAYRLNPNSPTYHADFAQMAKEQKVNLSQLDKIESLKGGHGQIDQAKIKTAPKSTDTKTLITVQLPNGTTGQIPKEKYNDFIKKYPTAKTLQ